MFHRSVRGQIAFGPSDAMRGNLTPWTGTLTSIRVTRTPKDQSRIDRPCAAAVSFSSGKGRRGYRRSSDDCLSYTILPQCHKYGNHPQLSFTGQNQQENR